MEKKDIQVFLTFFLSLVIRRKLQLGRILFLMFCESGPDPVVAVNEGRLSGNELSYFKNTLFLFFIFLLAAIVCFQGTWINLENESIYLTIYFIYLLEIETPHLLS